MVESGETLYGIAQQYYGRGMAWRDLAEANPDLKPGRLLVGQKVVIPGPNRTGEKEPVADARVVREEVRTAPATKPEAEARYHVVAEGESLYTIAARYYGSGHQWRRIQEANASSLDDWQIRPGMKLLVP